MLEPYKSRSTLGVAGAMVVFVLGAVGSGTYYRLYPQAAQLGWYAAFVLGSVLWVWGCFCHARARGYSKWLGVLGLFAWPGLLILLILPDRTRDPSRR